MDTWTQSIDARHVAAIWPFCVEHAADAIERGAEGSITLGDLYRALIEGRMTLWIAISGQKVVASAITQVVEYPQLKSFRVVTLGGTNMAKWLPQLDAGWVEMARKLGATRIEAQGRKGWARAVKALGYAEGGYTIIKDVDPPSTNIVSLKQRTGTDDDG